MAKNHFTLQHSESVVVQAAAQIYAAYITGGRVNDKNQVQWMKRAIKEAIMLARGVDDAVISDEEINAIGGEDIGSIAVGRIQASRNRHDE